MEEDDANGGKLLPVYFGMGLPELGRNLPSCLADALQMPSDFANGDPVAGEFAAIPAGDLGLDNRARVTDDIYGSTCIVLPPLPHKNSSPSLTVTPPTSRDLTCATEYSIPKRQPTFLSSAKKYSAIRSRPSAVFR